MAYAYQELYLGFVPPTMQFGAEVVLSVLIGSAVISIEHDKSEYVLE